MMPLLMQGSASNFEREAILRPKRSQEQSHRRISLIHLCITLLQSQLLLESCTPLPETF